MENIKENINKIAILGASESGLGAAILAKQKGYTVFVSDIGIINDNYKQELIKFGIRYEENKHTLEILLEHKTIIKSPGIPNKSAVIKAIKNENIELISEIEFAGRFTDAKIIGITGTNGKTTTASLVYYILKEAGKKVIIAGNIGYSFARALIEKPQADYYVLELSSFQLEDIKKFKSDIAIILNITEDHLDIHTTMDEYIKCKLNIIKNQNIGDVFIYNADDELINTFLDNHNIKSRKFPMSLQIDKNKLTNGATKHGENIVFKDNNKEEYLNTNNFALYGNHNMYNSMAAIIAARLCDVKSESLKQSLQSFKNIDHRLEKVATIKGIKFINDSKATNINATWYALESTHTKIILLMGGVDKGNDYNKIKELVKNKVKVIINLTKDPKQSDKLHEYFQNYVDVINAFSMQEAVKMSYEIATKGDTVLLSPACASFDLFKSYKDRGKQFKEAVLKL